MGIGSPDISEVMPSFSHLPPSVGQSSGYTTATISNYTLTAIGDLLFHVISIYFRPVSIDSFTMRLPSNKMPSQGSLASLPGRETPNALLRLSVTKDFMVSSTPSYYSEMRMI